MLKYIAGLLIFAIGLPAMAAKPNPHCLKIVGGDYVAPEPYDIDVISAGHWLTNLLQGDQYSFPSAIVANPAFQAFLQEHEVEWHHAEEDEGSRRLWVEHFLFDRWQFWNRLNDEQRDIELSLELRMLSPASDSLHATDGGAQLSLLSKTNLARLTERMKEHKPLSGRISSALQNRIKNAVAALNLSYFFTDYEAVKNDVVHPPLVSQGQLNNYGFLLAQGFYSRLLGGAPSVSLEIGASLEQKGVYASPGAYRSFYMVNSKYARAHGFIMPRFFSSEDLARFFAIYDPSALTAVYNSNAYKLPLAIKSQEDFNQWIVTGQSRDYFTNNMRSDLYHFRSRLRNFVMTPADGETFLRGALIHMLSVYAKTDTELFEDTMNRLNTPGGPELIFGKDLMRFIGWSAGATMRIPGSVPNTQIEVIRGPGEPDIESF